jgi:dipeptidyl-peptidase 4
MPDSFPRQYARTQRFTLGEPRNVSVSTDGQRVVFLRSRAGDDPVNCLWVIDLPNGPERLVADPLELLAEDSADHEALSPEERAQRERRREGAGGITSFATCARTETATFSLGGRLFLCDLTKGGSTEVIVPGPVFDPRVDPTGTSIAYVNGPRLCVTDTQGTVRVLAGPPFNATNPQDAVTWGSAEFIAAEEMQRMRGYWWSPDGQHLAVTRVDDAPVQRWYIADPADPAAPPRQISYPAAGTANAAVTLHIFTDVPTRLLNPSSDASGESSTGESSTNESRTHESQAVPVPWDTEASPYLARVSWTQAGLVVALQSRDQRRVDICSVDHHSGALTVLTRDTDPAWVDLLSGVPTLLTGPESTGPEGKSAQLLYSSERSGTRVLLLGETVISRTDQVVRSVVSADPDQILYSANPISDATCLQIWAYRPNSGPILISAGDAVCSASSGGSTLVMRTARLDSPQATWQILNGERQVVREITNLAETPLVTARPQLFHTPRRSLAVAVLLPTGYDPRDPDTRPLPVLMDPYGGPHAQRVLRSHNAFATSQWFADQGFAVVVADGRGTPGRGTEFERAVLNDLAAPVLEDQIEALEHAAASTAALDLSRVAIRGWSFGGYLAALAVLRRPDVFHAGIAGAPVTEWRLYDTHYTERYLGDPNIDPSPYERTSLLPLATDLRRPLLLIHGLADDNVVAAHTLQLSRALLEAGRSHEVLPLVGVSHMTPQEVVAENLLRHQLDFLRRALGIRHP